MKKIIVAMALVLGCSSLAWGGAPGGPGPHGKGPGMELRQLLSELDLSDAQKTKAASILKRHREELGVRTAALSQTFEQAQENRPEPGRFEESALRKGHERISAALIELLVLKEKIISELYLILTPEQQKVLQAMMCPPPRPGHEPGEGKPMGEPGAHKPGESKLGPSEGRPMHGPGDELPWLDAFIKAHS